MDHWLAIPHGDWRPFIPIFLAASSFLPYSCTLVQGCCVLNTMATWEKRWNQDGGQLRCFAGDQMCIKLHLLFFLFAININNDRIPPATLNFLPQVFLPDKSFHTSFPLLGGWGPLLTALLHHFNSDLFAHSTFTNRNVFKLRCCLWNSALSKIVIRACREVTLSELMLIKDSSKVH